MFGPVFMWNWNILSRVDFFQGSKNIQSVNFWKVSNFPEFDAFRNTTCAIVRPLIFVPKTWSFTYAQSYNQITTLHHRWNGGSGAIGRGEIPYDNRTELLRGHPGGSQGLPGLRRAGLQKFTLLDLSIFDRICFHFFAIKKIFRNI